MGRGDPLIISLTPVLGKLYGTSCGPSIKMSDSISTAIVAIPRPKTVAEGELQTRFHEIMGIENTAV